MKLFLDDVRNPKECSSYMHKRIGVNNLLYLEDWTIARNFEEFTTLVTANFDKITHISFDHDLGDEHYATNPESIREAIYGKIDYKRFKEKTGYDCALWLKNHYEHMQLTLPIMFVHSMNPVGTENIINLFKYGK